MTSIQRRGGESGRWEMGLVSLYLSLSLPLSLCLSVSAFMCLCVYVSVSLSVCMSVSVCLCVGLSVFLSVSFCLCFCLCLSVSVWVYIKVSGYEGAPSLLCSLSRDLCRGREMWDVRCHLAADLYIAVLLDIEIRKWLNCHKMPAVIFLLDLELHSAMNNKYFLSNFFISSMKFREFLISKKNAKY